MMYKNPSCRLPTTAIATVLAFAAAPLLAQSTTPSTDTAATGTTAPVLATPPFSIAPAAPATAPAYGPAARDVVPQDAPEATTAPATAPVLDVPTVAQATPVTIEPAPATPPIARKAVRKWARRSAWTPPMADRAPDAVTVAPPAQALPEPSPVAVAIAPAVPTPQPAAPSATNDVDMLPMAGIAGLGALAMAGGALALHRRRRRLEGDIYADGYADIVHPEVDIAPEPMFATPATPAPAAPAPSHTRRLDDPRSVVGPLVALPAFDLSRYGRHVQAAYRGPTPDNPSPSLKTRLKRANLLDQRDRLAALPHEAPAQTLAVTPTIDRPPAIAPAPAVPITSPVWQPNFRPTLQR